MAAERDKKLAYMHKKSKRNEKRVLFSWSTKTSSFSVWYSHVRKAGSHVTFRRVIVHPYGEFDTLFPSFIMYSWPYLCMGQRGQHRQRHTYVWVNAVNTGNAILMYGSTRST